MKYLILASIIALSLIGIVEVQDVDARCIIPLESPCPRNPENIYVKDEFGNSLDKLEINKQVWIQYRVTNYNELEYLTSYQLEITNQHDQLVHTESILIPLLPSESFETKVAWIPSHLGEYRITINVFTNPDNAELYLPTTSTSATVLSTQKSLEGYVESYKEGFTVGNVTSKITGQTMKEKLTSVPICEDLSNKFPNSALTFDQKIIKLFYQSDLVVTGQVVNKTAYSSNEKNWDVLKIKVEDIINPIPNFSNNVENPIILVSSKCWSYSGNLENEWSFDVDDNVFLYLNRIHDVRFTISNPIKDITIDSNIALIPSPLIQNKAIWSGMWNDNWSDLYCKPSLVSITKPNAEFACVTSSTAEKLIERGWIS